MLSLKLSPYAHARLPEWRSLLVGALRRLRLALLRLGMVEHSPPLPMRHMRRHLVRAGAIATPVSLGLGAALLSSLVAWPTVPLTLLAVGAMLVALAQQTLP